MIYSEKVDGMFCIVCTMFCTDPFKGYFVSKLFCMWKKKVKMPKSMSNLNIIKSVWNWLTI